MTDHSDVPDAAKAALSKSDIIAKLKTVFGGGAVEDGTAALKAKAQAMAEDLQQLLDSGRLEGTDKLRISSILNRLRGAMQGGGLTREALATALAEATAAIGTASSSEMSLTPQQKKDQLWQEIEQRNKSLDYAFNKMREAGIYFDKELWEQHKHLTEEMLAHPRDIEKQKELDAVDDLTLRQAEPQLARHPNAKPHFDEAKKAGEDRHAVVDQKLAAITRDAATINSGADLDWDSDTPKAKVSSPQKLETQNVTMDDVAPQNIGQKLKGRAITISCTLLALHFPVKMLQIFVYMHTNLRLRTKPTH